MNSDKLKFIISMLIFGSIGIFRNMITYSSGIVAFARGLIGALFLLIIFFIKKEALNKASIKKNIVLLVFSGMLLGANWVFLFEAYRYTTVSAATLCYYMAPVFVVLISPVILHEALSAKRIICALISVAGMVIISNAFSGSIFNARGIIFGLGAAVLYAGVIITNKFIHDISDYLRTVIQLASGIIPMIIYIIFTQSSLPPINGTSLVLLLIIGIVHTGIAYMLYFGSLKTITAQTAATLSYIDPLTAITLSALILKEHLTLTTVLGAMLILGATIISEHSN